MMVGKQLDSKTDVAQCDVQNPARVHMLGVSGVGMAGVAWLLKARGFSVSGCDLTSNRITEWLVSNGIECALGHDPSHITDDIDYIIRSAAVPEDCAEICAAREKGIPVFKRGEVLPRLLNGWNSVAVSGTHGKTSTSTFITQILKSVGRNPGWCIGAENDALGGVAGGLTFTNKFSHIIPALTNCRAGTVPYSVPSRRKRSTLLTTLHPVNPAGRSRSSTIPALQYASQLIPTILMGKSKEGGGERKAEMLKGGEKFEVGRGKCEGEIERPTSNIQHRTSNRDCSISNIEHSTSNDQVGNTRGQRSEVRGQRSESSDKRPEARTQLPEPRTQSPVTNAQSPVTNAQCPMTNDQLLVVEADESDGTLALYAPEIGVVTNIEFDHMEHFDSEDAFFGVFERFIVQCKKRVWFCADDAKAAELCAGVDYARGYGFGDGAFLRGCLKCGGEDRSVSQGQGLMSVYRNDELLGELRLPVLGEHNALNLLAAAGVCLDLGVSFEEIAGAMVDIVLPRRRYELVSEKNGIKIISDYAHHPSEIAALVKTARSMEYGAGRGKIECPASNEAPATSYQGSKTTNHGRLLVVFQPHRYSRTLALGANFPEAFKGVDLLVFVPVYAASEKPIAGGRVCDLYEKFRDEFRGDAKKIGLTPLLTPLLAESLEQAWDFLKRELRSGDTLLIVGAGDIEKIAEWAGGEKFEVGSLKCEGDEWGEVERSTSNIQHRTSNWGGIGRFTTYGVGGCADKYLRVENVARLKDVLRECGENGEDFRILGGGSNVLVSDLGVSGVVARLTGGVFREIRRENGVVVVGAGVSVAKLLVWVTKNELGGLEFLEGIPAVMGGVARMNAGAYGHEICESVLWIRGLNKDGTDCILKNSELKWKYRGCPQLEDLIVVEVGLGLEYCDKALIIAERERLRALRKWQKGMRCAGSVFRNPNGKSAGEIIDDMGLKGCRIGGAYVSCVHANMIVADRDATASDVLALIQKVEAVVFDGCGVKLEREVICWS